MEARGADVMFSVDSAGQGALIGTIAKCLHLVVDTAQNVLAVAGSIVPAIINGTMQNKKTISIVCIFTFGCVLRRQELKHLSGTIINWTTNKFARKYLLQHVQPIDNEHIRKVFRSTPPIVYHAAKSHSHGKLAADRSAAVDTIRKMLNHVGLTMYSYQMSKRDVNINSDGSREHYWVKDLALPMREDKVEKHHAIVSIDVDYYNIPVQHLINGHNMFIYTMLPTAAAYSEEGGEFTYYFNEANEIEMFVSGGARYKHVLNDWGRDTVCFWQYGTWKQCFLPQFVACNVEHRNTGVPHHAIVGLFPFLVCGPIAYWAMRWLGMLNAQFLEPLKPVQGPYVVLDVFQQGRGHRRSVGLVGKYLEASFPVEIVDGCSVMSQCMKSNLTPSAIIGHTQERDKAKAALISEYVKSTDHKAKVPVVISRENSIQHYTYPSSDTVDDSKEAVLAYCSPIISGCTYAPTRSKGNDEAAARERVVKLASNPPWPLGVEKLMDHFLELLIPEPNLGIPVDHDTVWENQGRPTQRTILEQSVLDEADNRNKSFMKAETYSEVKDPRVISTIHGVNKREYSRFTYAVAEHIKTMPWYAFGKTPVEVARQITAIFSEPVLTPNGIKQPTSGVETDFSRMDGLINPLNRELEKRLYKRFFHQDYTAEVLHYYSTQYNMRGEFSATGVFYDQLAARASGSPHTSIMNTVQNAFCQWCCILQWTPGADVSPEAGKIAFDMIGACGGDDGAAAEIDPTIADKVASYFGFKLKCKPVKIGDRVSFLARFWGPDIWNGDNNSCCDIKRTLAKFHVTTDMLTLKNGMAERKFLEKVGALSLTDRNTPIIGHIVRKVEKLGYVLPTENNCASWFSRYPESVQFPNEFGQWMLDLVQEQMPGFDWTVFREHINKSQTLTELMKFPVCYSEDQPLPDNVVVNGDVKAPLVPPKPIAAKTKPKVNVTCKQCGKVGHFKSDCRSRRKNKPKKQTPTTSGGAVKNKTN